jgi:hypothetical protein
MQCHPMRLASRWHLFLQHQYQFDHSGAVLVCERQNDGMIVTQTIRYKGGSARVGALVQMLEAEGAHVDWEHPQERRDLSGVVEQPF